MKTRKREETNIYGYDSGDCGSVGDLGIVSVGVVHAALSMNKEIIEKLFPGAIERMEHGRCPICGDLIDTDDFEDELSIREFQISGMCQKCQDKTFGK